MVSPLQVIVDLVNQAFHYSFGGSQLLMGLVLLGAIAYAFVRTKPDRCGVTVISVCAVGILVGADWVQNWVWGVIILLGAVIVGFAMLKMGGDRIE